MAASAQDVQKQIDKGTSNLAQTGTTSYASDRIGRIGPRRAIGTSRSQRSLRLELR